MYVCPKHGKMESHWCEECQELYNCNCSELTRSRFKDLIINCEDGERTVTVYIEHCSTCGNPVEAKLK